MNARHMSHLWYLSLIFFLKKFYFFFRIMNKLVKVFILWYAVIIYDLSLMTISIYGWFIVHGLKVGVHKQKHT